MVALNKAYCISVNQGTFEKLLNNIQVYLQHKEELGKIDCNSKWYIFNSLE